MGSQVFLPPHVELLAVQAFPGGAHSTTGRLDEIVPGIIKTIKKVQRVLVRDSLPPVFILGFWVLIL